MALVHRHSDLRACGATTVVVGQSSVHAGNKLVSVVGDPNSHGAGNFLVNGRKVFIGSKQVIGVSDAAAGDNALHPTGSTNASTGIATIVIG